MPQKHHYKPIANTCSEEFHSVVPHAQSFTTKIHFITLTELIRRHSLHISDIKMAFPSGTFFLSTATLWNRLSSGCFPNHYTLYLFIFKVNQLTFSSPFLLPPLVFLSHRSFSNLLPCMAH